MDEGNEVAGVKSMPEGTDNHGVELCLRLPLLSLLLVRVVFWVVEVLIDVSSQGPLHADVPVVDLYLHVWLQVKFSHVVNFDSPEVIAHDCPVFLLDVVPWIIGYP